MTQEPGRCVSDTGRCIIDIEGLVNRQEILMSRLLLDLLADYQALLRTRTSFRPWANDCRRRSSQRLSSLELVNGEPEHTLYSVSIHVCPEASNVCPRALVPRPIYLWVMQGHALDADSGCGHGYSVPSCMTRRISYQLEHLTKSDRTADRPFSTVRVIRDKEAHFPPQTSALATCSPPSGTQLGHSSR